MVFQNDENPTLADSWQLHLYFAACSLSLLGEVSLHLFGYFLAAHSSNHGKMGSSPVEGVLMQMLQHNANLG